MHKDVRFKTVRDLIKTRSITTFDQIFDTIPKSVFAKPLKKNPSRMDALIANPEELRYKEIKAMSQLLDVPKSMIIQLFDKDFS